MCRKWLRSELCAAKLLYTLLGKRFTAHLQRWDDRKKYQTQKPLQHQILFLKLDFANMSLSWVYNMLKCCLTSWNSWTRSPALIKSALWRSAYSSLWGSVYDMMQSTNASASVAHGGSIGPERDAARRWCFFIRHYLKWQKATLEFGLPAISMETLGDGWRRAASHPFHFRSCLYWNVCRDKPDSFRQARVTFFGFKIIFGLLILW